MLVRHAGKSRAVVATVLGMVLGWGGLAGVAHAALITFKFEGNVNAINPLLNPPFTLSDKFQGFYSFNSLTPDRDPDARTGSYRLANASLTLGGKTYSMGTVLPNFIAVVLQDGLSNSPSYNVVTTLTGSDVNGFFPASLTLKLAGNNLFTNDSLPLSPPGLANLNTNSIRFDMGGFDPRTGILGTAGVSGEITSLTAVPLPGAVLLFGTGLISLAALGRRHLKKLF